MTSFLAAGAGLMPAGTAAQAVDGAASVYAGSSGSGDESRSSSDLKGIAFPQFACPLMMSPGVRLFKAKEQAHPEPAASQNGGNGKDRKSRLPKWGSSPEGYGEALRYVVETQLGGDASRVNRGKAFKAADFKLASGEKVSGNDLIETAARLECPGKPAKKAMRSLGGRGEVTRIMRERYLSPKPEAQEWSRCYGRLRRALKDVVEKELGGDTSALTASNVKGKNFRLADGTRMDGAQLIFAVAHLERPDMEVKDAVQALGGEDSVLRIAREKYLFSMDAWADGPIDATNFILNYLMDGNEQALFEEGFARKLFLFTDGSSITGEELIDWARESLGLADEEDAVVMRGLLNLVTQARDLPMWGRTPQKLVKVLTHVLEDRFEGDPSRIDENFPDGTYSLPSGVEVKGADLMNAVAMFERPGKGPDRAIRELGGKKSVLWLIRDRYLSGAGWEGTESDVEAALAGIIESYYDGDARRVHSSRGFEERVFELSSGELVTGRRILEAAASLEVPGKQGAEAVDAMGGAAEVMRSIRAKHSVKPDEDPDAPEEERDYWDREYVLPGLRTTRRKLVAMFRASPKVRTDPRWRDIDELTDQDVIERLEDFAKLRLEDNEESIRRVLKYVVKWFFGGDPRNIPSFSAFKNNSYRLPDNYEVTGAQILNAVALVECPDRKVKKAQTATFIMGGPASVFNLVLRKYLGLSGPDLERIRQLPASHFLEESPLDLLELVRIMLPEGELVSPEEFMRGFEALNLKEVAGAGAKRAGGGKQRSTAFLDALFTRRELLEELDEQKIERLCELFINVLYRDFATRHDEILPYLHDSVAQEKDPLKVNFYRRAIAHFEAIESFELVNVRSQPFLHQLAAVKFLTENDGAILADEPGLGKTLETLAAAEKLGVKRVLIVTPKNGTGTWEEEIEKHIEGDPGYIVLDKDDKPKVAVPAANRDFMEELEGAKYIIVNYEALREDDEGMGTNPLLSYLRDDADLDLVVLDEGHLADNPKENVQQARAVRSITPRRRWFVSATPYQSKPQNLFTALSYVAPEDFTWDEKSENGSMTFKKFKKTFFRKNEESPRLLNGLLRKYMLRRRKDQVLGTVDPALPLEEQHGRLPRMNYVNPNEEGKYVLSVEQAEMMRSMIENFPEWAEAYNEWAQAFNAALPPDAPEDEDRKIIDLDKRHPFQKINYIRRLMSDPEYVGMEPKEGLYTALDGIVERYIGEGKKIIIFANFTRNINEILRRYSKHGAVRVDRKVKGLERDEARHLFNLSPAINVFVAQPQSGGVNINLPAGDVVIFVNEPKSYVLRFQAEHRANRADPTVVKPEVKIISMIGTYPEGFVDSVSEDIREYLEAGTVAEIESRHISSKRREFLLVMDGYISREDFERSAREERETSMGWLRDDLPARIRRKPAMMGVLEKLYEKWRELPQGRRRDLEKLGDHILELDFTEADVEVALKSAESGLEVDAGVARTAFEIRNKFIRQNLVKRLFIELPVVHEKGKHLKGYAKELTRIDKFDSRLLVPALLFAKPWFGDDLWQATKDLVIESTSYRGVKRDYFSERLASVLAELMDDAPFEAFFEGHSALFTDSSRPIEERMGALSDLAMLKGSNSRLFKRIAKENFEDLDALRERLDEVATRPVIGAMKLPNTPETRARVREIYEEWGTFEPLLALHLGYVRAGLDEYAKALREVFAHVVAGDYREWRNEQTGEREDGKKVTYLEDEEAFWSHWSEESVTAVGDVHVGSRTLRRSLIQRLGYIMTEAMRGSEMGDVEGARVLKLWRTFVDSSGKGRGEIKDLLEVAKQKLGLMLSSGGGDLPIDELNALGIGHAHNGRPEMERVRDDLRAINAVRDWISINEAIMELASGGWHDAMSTLDALLTRKLRVYSGDKTAVTAISVSLYNAIEELRRVQEKEKVYKDIEIVDTDDPLTIMRMGALRPDLINCFNYHGNPMQNKTILDVLGSRNKRLLVVKEGGEIVAVAVAKMRRLEEEEPIIFLERALYRGGYDFRDEMLAHLKKKREGLSPETMISYQILHDKKKKPGDVTVYSTGSYVEHEYAEALFHEAPEQRVYHRARPIPEDVAAMQAAADAKEGFVHAEEVKAHVFSYGTSNHELETFMEAMEDNGVKVVVDIRSRPQSQYFPYFNRRALAASLRSAGYGYVWHGELLGGYPPGYDGDFERYMKEDPDGKFSAGIESLRELIEKHGKIAIICSEGDEGGCHRRFIMRYLKAHGLGMDSDNL